MRISDWSSDVCSSDLVTTISPPKASRCGGAASCAKAGVATVIASTEVPIRALNFIYILPFPARGCGPPKWSVCGKGRGYDSAWQRASARRAVCRTKSHLPAVLVIVLSHWHREIGREDV